MDGKADDGWSHWSCACINSRCGWAAYPSVRAPRLRARNADGFGLSTATAQTGPNPPWSASVVTGGEGENSPALLKVSCTYGGRHPLTGGGYVRYMPVQRPIIPYGLLHREAYPAYTYRSRTTAKPLPFDAAVRAGPPSPPPVIGHKSMDEPFMRIR